MILRCAMASNTVASSLAMWVAPLVRVSKFEAVASMVRSRPWPSLNHPPADSIASSRS